MSEQQHDIPTGLVWQLWARSPRLDLLRNRILFALRVRNELTFNELVYSSGIDYRSVLFVVRMLLSEGQLQGGPTIRLINVPIEASHRNNVGTCSLCAGRGVVSTDSARDRLLRFRRISHDESLQPSLFLGQRGVTADSVIARTLYMESRGDLRGKRIAILGDNDLFSICLALINTAAEIHVFDIDRRMIDAIQRISHNEGLSVITHLYDALDPVPTELAGMFDIFFADPYPTPDASFEKLFWTRGLHLLSHTPGRVGYTMVAPTHKSPGYFLASQRVITDLGLVVTDLIPRFTSYVPIHGELIEDESKTFDMHLMEHPTISHTKSLLRFETTEATTNYLRSPELMCSEYDESWLQQWYTILSTHDLVRSLGLEDQMSILFDAVGWKQSWRETSSRPDIKQRSGFISVENILQEITPRKLTNDEFISLIENDGYAIFSKSAEESGFYISHDEIKTLYFIAIQGWQGLRDSGLPGEAQYHLIYEVARILDSYFRQKYIVLQ